MFDTLAAEPETSSPGSAEREWADCSGAVLGVLVANGLAGLEQLPDTRRRRRARPSTWRAPPCGSRAGPSPARAKAVAQVYARTLAEHQRTGQARASHGYDASALTRSQVAANLSLELTISLSAADLEVRFALALDRHPAIALALATGRIQAGPGPGARLRAGRHPAALGRRPRRPRAADRPDRPDRDAGPRPRATSARVLGCGSCPIGKLKSDHPAGGGRRSIPESVARPDQGRPGPLGTCATTAAPTTPPSWSCAGRPTQLAAVDRSRSTATPASPAGRRSSATLDQLRFDLAVGRADRGRLRPACGRDSRHEPARPADPGRAGPPTGSSSRQQPGVLINVTAPAPTLAGGNEPGVLHGPDGDIPAARRGGPRARLRARTRDLAAGPVRPGDRPGPVDLAARTGRARRSPSS